MKLISEINAETKLAAVIGSPIKHSKSPRIYNLSFERDELNAVYLAFEADEAETAAQIEALKNLGVIGINITMPGKFKALQTVQRLNSAAEYVQAVNMIVPEEDAWVGYNTDGAGFWENVKSHGVNLPGKAVVIYGSGNTARVIAAQAVIEGASSVKVIARNLERPLEVKDLLEQLKTDYPETSLQLIDLADEDNVKQVIATAGILVQSTSVGMAPNDNRSILSKPEWLNAETVVCDVVYEPHQTKLIKQAQERGCKVIGGIGMLVHQAALNYKLMTGRQMDTKYILNKLTS